jgi:hypothetical protein
VGYNSDFQARQGAYDNDVNTAHDADVHYVGSNLYDNLGVSGEPSFPSGINLGSLPQYLNYLHWVYDTGGYEPTMWPIPFFGPISIGASQITQILMGNLVLALDQLSVFGGTLNSVTGGLDNAISAIDDLAAVSGGVSTSWVEQLVEQAEQQATAQYNSAVSYSQQLYNQSISHADQDQVAAEQQATAQYNQATSYSQQLYNQAISHADQDMAAAEQQATNQHNQAEQDAQNAANQAQSNAQGYTDGAVRGAEALAAASLALQVASDAAEFATLTAGVAAVADLAGDAIMANGLLQLLEAGAFFGFLALAIKEPVGTANVSVGVLDPLLDQAGALVDDVIGFLV